MTTLAPAGSAQLNSLDNLSARAVQSMADVVPAEYDTIAIWQIGGRTNSARVDLLLDELQLKIINSHRFKLIDRRRLDLILKEQKFTLSGLVDPATMKKFGQVSGGRQSPQRVGGSFL